MTRPWRDSAIQVTGRPRRLHPMIVGYEPIAESMSMLGGDPARFLLEPVTAAAVVYDDGWVLLDSGFNVDVVREDEKRRMLCSFDSYTPVIPPGDPLRDQVQAADLDWADLAGVAISHTHMDHTGGLRLVPPGVPVVLQRAEWDFASRLTSPELCVIVEDFTRADLDVVLVAGDVCLAPGLWAIDTSGHTPGHQSFSVELPGETVVLACDAADLRANVDQRIPCGTTMRPEDAPLAVRAIMRLSDLDDREGTTVWPGHDPNWQPWSAAHRPATRGR